MRAFGWHRLQRLRNDLFNLPIGDFARCTDSRLIQQAIQPKLSKPFPPLTDGRAGDVQLPAASELLIPSPQLSTIRARTAMACDDFGRRASMLNFAPSSVLISSGFLGRPVPIPKYAAHPYLCNAFLAQDTSGMRPK
jgi:hypothetical protein